MPDLYIFITAGILFILLGFFLAISGIIRSKNEHVSEYNSAEEIKDEKVKGGGVVLIGPLPIVFGTDKRFAIIAMVLAIVIMLLAVIFMK